MGSIQRTQDRTFRTLGFVYNHGVAYPEFLKPKEVAEVLRCDPRTVIRMLDAGRLRGIRVGSSWRIAKEDFEAFLNGEQPQKKPAATSRRRKA